VCMAEVISMRSRDMSHPDWSRLARLHYDHDVSVLQSWISGVFERAPAPFPIQGLWIGLCNPGDSNSKIWADMYVGATAQYDTDDERLGWLWRGKRHYPKDAYAHSSSLRSI